MIHREKATFNQITLLTVFEGFENDNYMICTDRMRLKQVLLNYQSNAIKFSKPGGTVKILCRLVKDEPSRVEIEVHDTGYGIKRKD
jgi:two-component system sensor histidine kinase ChvG